MMITKTKPVGIDIQIQALQIFLFNQLTAIWQISQNDYRSYGRAYRNLTEDGSYSPEVYIGGPGGVDYTDAFFDDTFKVISFFIFGTTQKYNGGLVSDVALIFMTKASVLKPLISSRADEEVRRDVQLLVRDQKMGFHLQSVERGLDNVFREYSGWAKKAEVKDYDMQPWHAFRLNFKTDGYLIQNC